MDALDAIWAPLGTVLVAIVGGLGAWFLAKRKSGGTVKTSEATELWTANQEFRKMLMEEAKARTDENKALRQEAADCHKVQAELEKKVYEQEKRLYELERQVNSSERSPSGRHRPTYEPGRSNPGEHRSGSQDG